MKVALCTRNAANPVIRLLERTVRNAGHSADVIDDPRVVLTAGADRWDVAFWRPDSRDAQAAAFARQAAALLDGLGVPFLNSLASGDRAASKLVSQGLFAAHGLPIVPTWVAPQPGHPLADGPSEGPLIVKPIWGRRAQGVVNCASLPEALDAVAALGAPALLQRPIQWHHQHRCVTTPDRVLRVFRDSNPEPRSAAVRRFDRFTATPDPHPRAEVEDIARAMVAAVGGDLMRADVLEDAKGRLWALEVNSSFGFPHQDEVVLDAFLDGFRRLAGSSR